jgi:hypothetical protein
MTEEILPTIKVEFQIGNDKQTSKRIYTNDVVDDKIQKESAKKMLRSGNREDNKIKEELFMLKPFITDNEAKFLYPQEMISKDDPIRRERGITILCDDPLKADMIRMTVAGAIAAVHSVQVVIKPDDTHFNIRNGEISLQEAMMELEQKSFARKRRDEESFIYDKDEFDINKDGLHNVPPNGVTRKHHKMIMDMNKKGRR